MSETALRGIAEGLQTVGRGLAIASQQKTRQLEFEQRELQRHHENLAQSFFINTSARHLTKLHSIERRSDVNLLEQWMDHLTNEEKIFDSDEFQTIAAGSPEVAEKLRLRIKGAVANQAISTINAEYAENEIKAATEALASVTEGLSDPNSAYDYKSAGQMLYEIDKLIETASNPFFRKELVDGRTRAMEALRLNMVRNNNLDAEQAFVSRFYSPEVAQRLFADIDRRKESYAAQISEQSAADRIDRATLPEEPWNIASRLVSTTHTLEQKAAEIAAELTFLAQNAPTTEQRREAASQLRRATEWVEVAQLFQPGDHADGLRALAFRREPSQKDMVVLERLGMSSGARQKFKGLTLEQRLAMTPEVQQQLAAGSIENAWLEGVGVLSRAGWDRVSSLSAALPETGLKDIISRANNYMEGGQYASALAAVKNFSSAVAPNQQRTATRVMIERGLAAAEPMNANLALALSFDVIGPGNIGQLPDMRALAAAGSEPRNALTNRLYAQGHGLLVREVLNEIDTDPRMAEVWLAISAGNFSLSTTEAISDALSNAAGNLALLSILNNPDKPAEYHKAAVTRALSADRFESIHSFGGHSIVGWRDASRQAMGGFARLFSYFMEGELPYVSSEGDTLQIRDSRVGEHRIIPQELAYNVVGLYMDAVLGDSDFFNQPTHKDEGGWLSSVARTPWTFHPESIKLFYKTGKSLYRDLVDFEAFGRSAVGFPRLKQQNRLRDHVNMAFALTRDGDRAKGAQPSPYAFTLFPSPIYGRWGIDFTISGMDTPDFKMSTPEHKAKEIGRLDFSYVPTNATEGEIIYEIHAKANAFSGTPLVDPKTNEPITISQREMVLSAMLMSSRTSQEFYDFLTELPPDLTKDQFWHRVELNLTTQGVFKTGIDRKATVIGDWLRRVGASCRMSRSLIVS